MVRLSYPKERLSRLQERWSRPNPGLESDCPAPLHASRERPSPIHAQKRKPNQFMAQEGEPDLTKTQSGAHSLAMTHGNIYMEGDFRLAMNHEGMHALEV